MSLSDLVGLLCRVVSYDRSYLPTWVQEKHTVSVTLKVWNCNLQHQHHLGTCWKCRFSDTTLDLLSQRCRLEPSHLCFHKPPGDSDAAKV